MPSPHRENPPLAHSVPRFLAPHMRTTNPAVALFDRHRMKGHAKEGGMRALRTPPFDGLSYAPIEA